MAEAKNKKTILVFIDWYLPGYKAGGPIQSCANLVAGLRDYFNFYIITRNVDYCESTPYTNVQSDEWNRVDDATMVYYISSKKLGKKQLKHLLDRTPFDIAYINGIYSWHFSILPLLMLKKVSGKPVVVAPRGMFAQGAVSFKKKKKEIFLFGARILGIYQKVTFQATKVEEAEDIRRYLGNKVKIKLAPNLPKKSMMGNAMARKKMQGELNIVSIARISPEKNLHYALELLAEIQGNVQLNIYGPVYNEEYWKKCRDIIALLPKEKSVKYHGALSSGSIAQVLFENHVLLMPTLGENYGHVIVESLAAACPVLISDLTPWKDLQSKGAGWSLPLGSRGAFLAALQQLVSMDNKEYNAMSKAAFTYGKAIAEDQSVVQQSLDLFKEAIA